MTHFISTVPKLTQCPICKGWILECHVDGFRRRLEPNPLNFAEELKMRMKGRSIFQSIGQVEPTMVIRSLWHINDADPLTKVFPSHDCSTPEIFEPMPLFDLPQSASEGVSF